MKQLLLIVVVIVCLYLLYQVGLFIYRVHISKGLVMRAHPFTRSSGGVHMLVVGDSTAVGVGATSPAESTAGLFGRDFPNLSIENRAVSGATLAETAMQLRSASSSYDVILIQAGPNDVLSFHNLDASKQDAKALLTLAKEKSQHVVMLSGGNAGLVPLLPWPISELISERTRTVRSFLIALTGERQVAYVDLYKKRSEDEFSQNPKLFYAQDGLHPADSGYALWYTRIRETISAAYPTLVL